MAFRLFRDAEPAGLVYPTCEVPERMLPFVRMHAPHLVWTVEEVPDDMPKAESPTSDVIEGEAPDTKK